jgi:phosphate transport system protein
MTIQAVQAQSPSTIIHRLVSMGAKVNEAVEQAIAALLSCSTHQPLGLMENAVAIQEAEVALDQAVFAALQSGELAASDIRQAAAAININKDLARLGRLAANLGRKVSQVGEHRDHEDLSRLQPLAIAASHLCRQTLQSLTKMDLVLARSAAAGSACIDAYRNYVFRGPHAPKMLAYNEHSVHLIFASRCLEQIADYAIDLAENLLVFFEGAPCLQPESEARQQLAC